MTDNDRADKVRELLETAESMLGEMDADADFLVADIKTIVETAITELEHLEFDEEGHIVPIDDDDLEEPEESDEDDWEDDEDEDDDEDDFD